MGWGSRALGRSQDPSSCKKSTISSYTLPSFSAKSIVVGEMDDILSHMNSLTFFPTGTGGRRVSFPSSRALSVGPGSSSISPCFSPSAIHRFLRKQITAFSTSSLPSVTKQPFPSLLTTSSIFLSCSCCCGSRYPALPPPGCCLLATTFF